MIKNNGYKSYSKRLNWVPSSWHPSTVTFLNLQRHSSADMTQDKNMMKLTKNSNEKAINKAGINLSKRMVLKQLVG